MSVVREGQIWQSRDPRDLGKGPRRPGTFALGTSDVRTHFPRRVRVVEVGIKKVLVENVVTHKQTHIDLVRFSSRSSRGGFILAEQASAKYEYRITDLDGKAIITLSRNMQNAGMKLQRGRVETRTGNVIWEDVDG